ncbi:PAS domain S-box protein [Mucilaginibacter roseus]|uniref:histidine kinase n=1 Tax=Mucilaginibacter roseus TaxID=1528868 RepID=A0ABS8U136_9SPHI|nr:GAF domain-containing protein [Mucilaginibacter roseus]MCD8740831.1 PAS domain S-box protein [Mucilaginibacter roseus]
MPLKELERLQTVKRFLQLPVDYENQLQEITRLAAYICGQPTALITFIDEDVQHIKVKHNFDFSETPRCDAFCDHVIGNKGTMIVKDAMLDERFAANPLVLDDPHIRFYAGVPLTTHDGYDLGSLCVIGKRPSDLSPKQAEMLDILARQVISILEFEASVLVLKAQKAEMRRTEIELRSFFESSVEQHLLLNRNFEILAFNKAWNNHVRSAYGRSLERGKKMTDYIHPDHLALFYRDYNTALRGTAVFDERKLKSNGADAWFLVKFEPAFDAEGEIIGVSVDIIDITRRIQNEEMVQMQKQSLQNIAFMQSHELRRPVASILGLMDLINADGHAPQTTEWQYLQDSVKELDSMIRSIVDEVDKK